MPSIESILGIGGASDLRHDFNELISEEGTNFGDIEELLLDYGLEMDYVDQLF